MPSSGSSARMTSRKASCGASLLRRARSLAWRSRISSRRDARRELYFASASISRRRIGAASPISATFGLRMRAGSSRVGIDAHDLQILVDAPCRERHQQPGADRQHRVGLAPQFASERQRDAERIAAVEHAAAAPVGQHGRLQQVGEQRHFGRGILRAAAGDDQHALGFAQELRGRAHRVRRRCAAAAAARAAR